MGAVETDFTCAGMCGTSYLYAFSEVSRGPPGQNCSVAVSEFVDNVTSKMSCWCWTFGVLILFVSIFSSFLWRSKGNELDSPLLGK